MTASIPLHWASLLEPIDFGSGLTGERGDTWRVAFLKCDRNFVTLLAAHLELHEEVAALRKRVQRLEAAA